VPRELGRHPRVRRLSHGQTSEVSKTSEVLVTPLQRALARDQRLCAKYRDLLRDNYAALLLRRLRIVWYAHRASRRRPLYRGCRRFQLAVLACLDALIPLGDET